MRVDSIGTGSASALQPANDEPDPTVGTELAKPRLSLLRMVEMNVGFLGLQFSFGLQQINMSPIYQLPRR